MTLFCGDRGAAEVVMHRLHVAPVVVVVVVVVCWPAILYIFFDQVTLLTD